MRIQIDPPNRLIFEHEMRLNALEDQEAQLLHTLKRMARQHRRLRAQGKRVSFEEAIRHGEAHHKLERVRFELTRARHHHRMLIRQAEEQLSLS